MDNVHFIILNMNKNKDRWDKMVNTLNNLNINFTRVEAIDGFKLDNNNDHIVKQILSKRNELMNSVLKCQTFNQSWIYDGTIKTSFPGLNIYGNEGAKGLVLSNMKAFDECLKINKDYIYGLNDDNTKLINDNRYLSLTNNNYFKYQWFCILEDDAILNKDVIKKIENFLNDLSKNNDKIDIIILDTRIGGGAAGVLYNSSVISKLRKDLHPLSEFSITMEEKYNHSPLWDWKLWHYVNNNININFKTLPCIESGQFTSTINI